jgi:hypothetical protein
MMQPVAIRVWGDRNNNQTANIHSKVERWDGPSAASYYLPLKILLARMLVNATMAE